MAKRRKDAPNAHHAEGRGSEELERPEPTSLRSDMIFEALFENTTDVLFSIDRDLRLASMSSSVEHTLGYSPDELVGRSLSELDIVAEEDLERAISDASRVLAGEEIPNSEYAFIARDGSRRNGEVSSAPMCDQDGTICGLVSIARDITERKKGEEKLQRREQYYRSLIENSLDAIVILERDGTIRYESPSFARMIGEQRAGRDPFDFAHPDDLPHAAQLFAQLLETPGSTVHTEVRIRHADGSWRTLEVVGHNLLDDDAVNGIVVNMRDITERKKADEALSESEARYRLLAENVTDVITSTDLALNPTYLSPSITRLLGYTPEEAMARTVEESLTPASREAAMEALARQLESDGKEQARGTGPSGVEFEFYRKDGSTVWVEVTVSFLRDENGQPVALVNLLRDIDARKKAEAEKQAMEQQLLLSGRLAAVGELAAGVAHELNNTLAAVQAYSQFLTSKKDLDESTRKDAETIYREAQRASKITANLLSFARRLNPEKTLISVNEVIERSLELHTYRLKKSNIEAVMYLDPNLPRIMADFNHMQQVFVNLIANAEHAMAEAHNRGTLVIKTERSGETIRVTLTDDGPGIPETDLKRMFDPFFTTRDVGQGTGLGLSICFGIVQEHGGSLYATSAEGTGTTLTVELPIVAEDHPSSGDPDSAKVQGE